MMRPTNTTSIRVRLLPNVIVCLFNQIFSDFKSKKIRVNLNQPIKAEVKAESSDVLKTVDEDRKYVIQATIVRCALL
jgi:hypothetical protein